MRTPYVLKSRKNFVSFILFSVELYNRQDAVTAYIWAWSSKRMILWTCLIAARQLSSDLTREDKSFTLLVCWTTQLIQYVLINHNNPVISWQCLKICSSSLPTCLEPNCNIGHKWTARRVRFIAAPLILTLWGRLTDRCVFTPITLYSVFRLLTRANQVP